METRRAIYLAKPSLLNIGRSLRRSFQWFISRGSRSHGRCTRSITMLHQRKAYRVCSIGNLSG